MGGEAEEVASANGVTNALVQVRVLGVVSVTMRNLIGSRRPRVYHFDFEHERHSR